jgi:hypothetical protein
MVIVKRRKKPSKKLFITHDICLYFSEVSIWTTQKKYLHSDEKSCYNMEMDSKALMTKVGISI